MARLDIVRVGEPVLRARANEVELSDIRSGRHRSLVRNMVETMRKAPGVGLAAPQVGVGVRLIVLEDADRLMAKLDEAQRRERGRAPFPLTVLYNPEIELVRKPVIAGEDDSAVFFEGCLSVPGFSALCPRAPTVKVRGLDEGGETVAYEVSGWVARIFQHEIDHLDGTLYLDRMFSRSFGTNEAISQHFGALSIAEARQRLGC